MGAKKIRHATNIKLLTIAEDAAISEEFEFSVYDKLIVHMPAAWTAASIGFQVSDASGGMFLPLYDDDGGLVQIDSPAVSKSYNAPAALAGAMFIKLWSQNGSGVDTNQLSADRTMRINVKS
jgi:hypothetical protein